MAYALRYAPSVRKDLRRLDPPVRERVLAHVAKLAADPRPTGASALQGRAGLRIRVGGYRIVYQINDTAREVLVLAVGPRQGIYKR